MKFREGKAEVSQQDRRSHYSDTQVCTFTQERRRTARKLLIHVVVPVAVKKNMDIQTLHAAASLTDVIIQHGTQLVGEDGSVPPPSSSDAPLGSSHPAAGPSPSDAPLGSSHPMRDSLSSDTFPGSAQPIEHICISCNGICDGVDSQASADGLTSHSCVNCGKICQASTTEDVALTDDLLLMVYYSELTQGATGGTSTPRSACYSTCRRVAQTPEGLSGAHISEIEDVTLSAIDFGLESYVPTPPSSRSLGKRKKSLGTLKQKKNQLGFTELMNAPDIADVQEREEELVIVASDEANPSPLPMDPLPSTGDPVVEPSPLPVIPFPGHFYRSPYRPLWSPFRLSVSPSIRDPAEASRLSELTVAVKKLVFDDPPQS